MKQSVKAYLPQLNELTNLSDLLQQSKEQKKYIAHCNEGEKPHLKNVVKPGEDVLILIGPSYNFV